MKKLDCEDIIKKIIEEIDREMIRVDKERCEARKYKPTQRREEHMWFLSGEGHGLLLAKGIVMEVFNKYSRK